MKERNKARVGVSTENASAQHEGDRMIGRGEIEEARQRLSSSIYLSPCARSETFSRLCGATTYFKLENLQMTGSFKERGALNKLLCLSAEERARGVITASAGNHGQAVAYHGGKLGIPSTIVMPLRTPLIKVDRTLGFGAEAILHGQSFAEAYTEARRLEEERQLTFVHPFDDDLVIAGQGTLALELLEQEPELEVVIVPVGGGGLISGIAVAYKALRPGVRIVGVQTAALPSMQKSLEAGRRVTLEPAQTIADGIAVKQPGVRTFEYVRRYVDEVVTVDDEEIANAILLLLEQEKAVVEGAGAATLAALYNGHVPEAAGKKTAMILSGGNIDVNLISRVIERGLAKDGRLVRLDVHLLDRPGALAHLLQLIAEAQANVLEIHHNRAFSDVGLEEADVEVTLETRGRDHVEALKGALSAAGFEVHEL